MNNIKQITNYNIQDLTKKTKTITKGEDTTVDWDYRVIPAGILGSNTIIKLGYCTNDPEGKYYPIFMTITTAEGVEEKEFQLGKTGMFEFQPEEWRDVNDDNVERLANPSISQILVPDKIPFVLDYCYAI